jgi:hypothetical protein
MIRGMHEGPEDARPQPPQQQVAYAYAYPVAAAPPEDLRRLVKNGWLCVIVGLLIPPLEFLAVAVAIRLMIRDRLGHALPMLVLAVVIFAVRAALYFG